MTFDVLAQAIHGALRDPSVGYVDFVWHGGEVTVLPVGFYRRRSGSRNASAARDRPS